MSCSKVFCWTRKVRSKTSFPVMAGALIPWRSRALPTLYPNTMNCRSASAVTMSTYAMDVPPPLMNSSTAPRAAFRQDRGLFMARDRNSVMSAAPRKSTRNGTRGYAHLVEIDVPVGRVWRALTDPGLIRIWSGQEAEIDARQGGAYQLGKRDAGGREAHIDIFDV